jgi:hypothetical protein
VAATVMAKETAKLLLPLPLPLPSPSPVSFLVDYYLYKSAAAM